MTHPQWRMLTSHSEPPSPAKAKFKDKDKSKAKAKMVGGPSSANPMRLERILSNRGVASRTEVAKVYMPTCLCPYPSSSLATLPNTP